MRISGFSFVRNGVAFDYPFLESISSLLPLVDEFVIAVGNSDDDTLTQVKSLNSPKIRIIETTWDESLRTGGAILAQQTNIALDHVTGDWAFYLQADEVIHEKDISLIRTAMEEHLHDKRVEGLLFKYLHFYGSFDCVGASRRWYRREIRVVRNGIGVRSWGDAQGFRVNGRKMNVKLIDATMYHYGWVKPPEVQIRKQQSFHKLWHDDAWVERNFGHSNAFDYGSSGTVRKFEGTHPSVMQKRISEQNWTFDFDEGRGRGPFKERFLDWIADKVGIRIGEYKNYKLI